MVPSVGEFFDVSLYYFKEIGYKQSVWAISSSTVPQAFTTLCMFNTALNWMTWEPQISN